MSWQPAFGYDNYVMRVDTVLTATSASVALPVTYLQIYEQGDVGSAWQTAAGVTSATLTITPALAGMTWRVMSLHRTNLTSSATVTFQLFTNPASLVDSKVVSGPSDGSGQVIWTMSADRIADYARVVINDLGNPLGALNIPLAYGGTAWLPLSGITSGSTHARDGNQVDFVSRGGQQYPIPTFQQRRWDIEAVGVRASEVWVYLDTLMKFAVMTDNILFIPNMDSAVLSSEAVYGIVTKTADVGFSDTTGDRQTMKLRITERL